MVVRGAIFRIDLQHAGERVQRLIVLPVEIVGATEVSPRGPVVGEAFQHAAVRLNRLLVPPVFLERDAPHPSGPGVGRSDGLRAPQVFVRPLQVAVAKRRFGDVQRAVDAIGTQRGDALESEGGASGVPLQQECDPVVVVAHPIGRSVRPRPRAGRSRNRRRRRHGKL